MFRQEEGVIEQGLLRHRGDADRTNKLKQDHDTPHCRHQPSERSAPAASPEEQQEPHHDEQVSGVDDPEVWIEGQRHQQCRGQSSEHHQQQEHGWQGCAHSTSLGLNQKTTAGSAPTRQLIP